MKMEMLSTQDEESGAEPRALIAERKAYVRNDEGQLVVYVPEDPGTSDPARTLTLDMDDDVRAFKRKARRLARQMNMGLDEIEIRQTTEYGELVAHMRQLTQSMLVAGLDTHQAAKLVQTLSYWMLRYGLTVFEHDELVRNLHALINPMRAPWKAVPCSTDSPTSSATAPSTPCQVNAPARFMTNCGSTLSFLPTATLADQAWYLSMENRATATLTTTAECGWTTPSHVVLNSSARTSTTPAT